MRILVVSLFFLFIEPASAITKCILNGKVSYKVGACPQNSTTQFLIKNRYVTEEQLQKNRQQRDVLSAKEFKRLNTPKRYDENGTLIKEGDQILETGKLKQEEEGGAQAGQQMGAGNKADTPKISEDENAKLLEMQRQFELRNKELQQLQLQ